jgi:hypothetical protein
MRGLRGQVGRLREMIVVICKHSGAFGDMQRHFNSVLTAKMTVLGTKTLRRIHILDSFSHKDFEKEDGFYI